MRLKRREANVSDKFADILWTATQTGFTARVAELTLSVVKAETERAISKDRKVLAFAPHRYRAFVEDAIVDPTKVFYSDLNEAKEKAIELARRINQTISEKRAKRRAEMMTKLGVDE
jgi:hypothetical protein